MNTSLEYHWFNSHADNDMLWLEDTLNWDNVFDLCTSEYNAFYLFSLAVFTNTHFYLSWIVKLSTLDVLLINEATPALDATSLYLSSLWEHSWTFSTVMFNLPFFFYSDFQDLLSTVSFYSPELLLGIKSFITAHWLNSSMGVSPASSFDLYQDLTGTSYVEFIDYLTSFGFFTCDVISIMVLTRLITVSKVSDAYATRVYLYAYSLVTEIRLSFEAGIQLFFFLFLYFSVMIATFDDDQEELLEFFNSMCFYFFLATLVYYFYKYSMHYFSFLEASKKDTKSSSALIQSLFDALNIIAFSLRFIVLIIRLNIYDGVDDCLDSYYIFMTDFDEEEYLSETFFSMSALLSFDSDANDDRSFLLEDEMDFSLDLFAVYFIVWGKFAYFWFFILEEIARVSLALYVTYLALFEINAVNRSYSEDNYLQTKRAI